jgi:hypothetical protein
MDELRYKTKERQMRDIFAVISFTFLFLSLLHLLSSTDATSGSSTNSIIEDFLLAWKTLDFNSDGYLTVLEAAIGRQSNLNPVREETLTDSAVYDYISRHQSHGNICLYPVPDAAVFVDCIVVTARKKFLLGLGSLVLDFQDVLQEYLQVDNCSGKSPEGWEEVVISSYTLHLQSLEVGISPTCHHFLNLHHRLTNFSTYNPHGGKDPYKCEHLFNSFQEYILFRMGCSFDFYLPLAHSFKHKLE